MDDYRTLPHIKLTGYKNDITDKALEILVTIRSNWTKNKIKLTLLTDGLTNTLVKCLESGFPESEAVLIRIHGNNTELLIDRKAEVKNLIMLNQENLAPKLYATFENGLAYQYVPGEILNCDNVIDPKIYRLVAKNMAKLHKVNVKKTENYCQAFVWDKMQPFLDLIPKTFPDQIKNKSCLCYADDYCKVMLPSKEKITEELEYLKKVVKELDSPLVFCHNDLLLGNVIYTKSENVVTFIDYEYAALNYQAFDIGNHFIEFVGCDLENLDYSRYPPKELQMDWLTAYLTELLSRTPTADEIEKLYVQSNKFSLLALVFWSLWGLIQAEHSLIDYDFLRYSARRIEGYFKRKEMVLALEVTR